MYAILLYIIVYNNSHNNKLMHNILYSNEQLYILGIEFFCYM